MTVAIALLVAFLIGSIPFGMILARGMLGVNLHDIGSGNIGASNAARAGGAKFGALILGLDAAKGYFSPCLAYGVAGWSSSWAGPLCGVVAVVGHCYTPWLRLRGGKGVATCLGVMLCLNPVIGGIGLAVYGATLALFRISALGSLAGCGVATLLAWVAPPGGPHLANSTALTFCFCLILWRHRSNLRFLLSNSESERS